MTVTRLVARARALLATRAVRVAFLLVVGVALAVTLRAQWKALRPQLSELHVGTLVLAEVAAVLAVLCSMLAWRAVLQGMGSALPLRSAAHVYLVGQLGKYLPGSVWALLGQVELAAARGVPRRRAGASAVASIAIVMTVGVLLAAAVLAPDVVGKAPAVAVWAVALGAAALLCSPRVVNGVVDRMVRLARQQPLEFRLGRADLLRTVGWGLAVWVAFGVHMWLLVADLGDAGPLVLVRVVGGFAAAWIAGFVFVVAPAGAGVREVVLALALGGVLAPAGITLAVLASRLVLTVADLLTGLAAVLDARLQGRTLASPPGRDLRRDLATGPPAAPPTPAEPRSAADARTPGSRG